MLDAIKILDVNITNESKEKILEYLLQALKESKKKIFISTPNPEMLVYASRHLDYKDKLNHSLIALPDGVGLFFASGFMGRPLKERIPGVDFIESLCEESKDNSLSMGFLGGGGGVAEFAAKRLLQKYPYLNIVFAASEWTKEGFQFRKKYQVSSIKYEREKNKKILNTKYLIHNTQIDILFVAFGVPKQEEWIYQNLDKIPVKAAMGVGGSFDFISGKVVRAPIIIRIIGLEWLFRLIIQPWRWKRQLALLEFIYLIFKEKFKEKR